MRKLFFRVNYNLSYTRWEKEGKQGADEGDRQSRS